MDYRENTLQTLSIEACRAGATAAVIIAAEDIPVEPELADRCRHPRCENYGLSIGCPPHVAGPQAFRRLLCDYSHALFFRIDVAAVMLYSSDNRQLFQTLHAVTAEIERLAVGLGFVTARGYAGDSCKRLFCLDEKECLALTDAGTCRHPQIARPSMSGFGINVGALLQKAGWEKRMGKLDGGQSGDEEIVSVCGLVLLC